MPLLVTECLTSVVELVPQLGSYTYVGQFRQSIQQSFLFLIGGTPIQALPRCLSNEINIFFSSWHLCYCFDNSSAL